MDYRRRILRVKEVESLTGYSRSHLLRMEKAGKFPRRIQLNPEADKGSAVGYFEDEIETWVRNRVRGVGRVPVARPGHNKRDTKSDTTVERVKPSTL